MPFFTYILYSPTADKYYIGHTADLEDRLRRHVNSGSESTKHKSDWVLKYQKEFDTRAEAMAHECEIKKKKSRRFI